MGSRRLKPEQAAAIGQHEVRLGHISGVFGLQGEVRLFLYNPETDLFAGAGIAIELVAVDGARKAVHLRSRSGAGKRILGRLWGVDTPEAARKLIGTEIVLAREALPQTDQNEFYHHQLVGLPVRSASGETIGRLTSIHVGPDTDVWIVHGPDGEAMIPAVEKYVLSVDLEDGIVVADGAGTSL